MRFAVAALVLVLAGCGGTAASGTQDDGTGTDAEWCAEIYPRHPDCVAELENVDDTVAARREVFLTWTHQCDATGGVFENCRD